MHKQGTAAQLVQDDMWDVSTFKSIYVYSRMRDLSKKVIQD
jgi:hypothetical protein